MKTIDFNRPILSLDGKPMKSDGNEIVMRLFVSNALCLTRPKKSENVIRQLNLAMKIFNSTTSVDLDDIEQQLLKDTLSEIDAATIVLGQILQLLE